MLDVIFTDIAPNLLCRLFEVLFTDIAHSFYTRYGNEETAVLLINHAANIGLTDINGSSPLHFAASRGLTTLVLKMLDTNMVDINIQDKQLCAPLHLAVLGCHFETCKLLLEKGASAELTNAGGETPWHLATAEGNVSIMTLLLEFKRSYEKLINGKRVRCNHERESSREQESKSKS